MSLKIFLSFVVVAVCNSVNVYSETIEPVCHHCEEIREYNAKYHQNFEYYDDYLKSQTNEKKGPVSENEPRNTNSTNNGAKSSTDKTQQNAKSKNAKSLL